MTEKGYFRGIEEALGASVDDMAAMLELSPRKYRALRDMRERNLGAVAHDAAYSALAAAVDERIAMLQLVRDSLRDRATRELAARLTRRAAIARA